MRPVSIGLKITCVLGTLVMLGTPPTLGEPLKVAVAANFRATAEVLAEEFTRATGAQVLITSAATGVLAAQMRRGAPFDVLLAADQTRPQALADEGRTLGEAICYAQGSLVLLGADDLNSNLDDALASADLSIAIANPRSAPYGISARAVLERPGLAGPDERRVIMGTNVQQTYQFWRSGAAKLALVARSLDPGSGIAIPTDWHPPIRQYAVINANTSQVGTARAWMQFLTGDTAQALLPGEGYEACP